MANAAVTITNNTSSFMSLDIKLDDRRVIRERLAPAGSITGASVDVGDKTTLDELNANPQVRALLDASPPKIVVDLTPGTTDIPGSDAQTAKATTGGFGGFESFSVASVPADGQNLLLATMPFACRIIDVVLDVSTIEATTWQLRDATGGGGNALSDSFSVAASTGKRRDTGTALAGVTPSLAKGGEVWLRKAASAAAVGRVTVTVQRV